MGLAIGMRAFDLLVALAARPNEVVGKDELMESAWPNFHVEEGNLRVQIAQLRRALANGDDAVPYISNEAGKGYALVIPPDPSPAEAAGPVRRASPLSASLPANPTGMIGRDEAIEQIMDQLAAHRLVSIVGTGGIGKTMVALAVGHRMADATQAPVHFVDIGAIADQTLLTGVVAASLGIALPPTGTFEALLRAIAACPRTIIFDNCEHLIDGIASLVNEIHLGAPRTLILATSREPLRLPQELVHRLPTLGLPPDSSTLSARDALTYPAVQLFTSRVSDTAGGYVLNDAAAPSVAAICRRLDGLAFAIELAAARFAIYGMSGVEDLLDHSAHVLPFSGKPG